MNLQILTPANPCITLGRLTLRVESKNNEDEDLKGPHDGVMITFGKYKGFTISEVYSEDKGYLYWCIKTPGVIRKNYNLTGNIREYLNFMKQKKLCFK